MKYFGIVRPNDNYIGWISHSEFDSWRLFFNQNFYTSPLATAITAYEAIGYKTVELDITTKDINDN